MKQQTLKDLKKAVRLLEQFTEDLALGRIFEFVSANELFDETHIFDNRFFDLTAALRPELSVDHQPWNSMIDYIMKKWDKKFALEMETAVNTTILLRSEANFIIGLFLGARIADPSGQVVSSLGRAWIRANMAGRAK
jgi:hypothetical protein